MLRAAGQDTGNLTGGSFLAIAGFLSVGEREEGIKMSAKAASNKVGHCVQNKE